MSAAEPLHEETDQHLTHVMSARTLLGVFAGLILLTVVTVSAAGAVSGPWEVWTALGIASAKSILVAAYFMHLRFDNPFHALLLLSAVGFVALFLGLTLADAQAYQPDIDAYLQRQP